MILGELLQKKGYDVGTAAQAIRALIANPDDLPQVFTIIDALSGNTAARLLRRLKALPQGTFILEDAGAIRRLLSDREALRAMPEGSLGRAYLRFVEAEGISAEGILEASERGGSDHRDRTTDEIALYDRMRDTHDLWHAVTGYQGDVLGELALLCFSFAQTLNPAVIVIVLAGVAKGLTRGNVGLLVEGYRRGRNAAWLPAVSWEDLLARPVDEVRAELRIGPLPDYVPLRSSMLRDAGLIAA